MEETYLVSVLTPIHNTVEPLLKRAFQSLKNQSFGFQNLEWVVLLHNCDEGCKEMVRKLSAGYPNIRLREADAAGTRVGYARNQTLRQATGKWVFFLDADDEMRADCIERVVLAMEESQADAAVMEALWHMEDKGILYWTDGLPEGAAVYEAGDSRIGKSLCMSGLTLWTRCYRRQFLSETGILFDETLREGEDLFFNLAATGAARRVITLPGFCGYDYYVGIGITKAVYGGQEALSGEGAAAKARQDAGLFCRIYDTGRKAGLSMDNYLWHGIWLCLRFWLFASLPDQVRESYKGAFYSVMEPVLGQLVRPAMLHPERQAMADYIYHRIMEDYFQYSLNGGRACARLSLDDCRLIGRGTRGAVYGVSADEIVKVYPGAGDDGKRAVTKLWSRGVWLRQNSFPIAKAHAVVETERGYGILTERISGTRIPQAVYEHPERLEEYGREIGRLLKRVHQYRDDMSLFPDARRGYYDMASAMERAHILERWESARIKALFNAIPQSGTLVHQDISLNNIILRGDELILIDQDDISTGHPMFDLIPLYRNLVSLAEFGVHQEPRGMTVEQYRELFQFILSEYYQTEDRLFLEEATRVLRGYGLLWLMCGALVMRSPHLTLSAQERTEMALAYKRELFSIIDTLHPISLEASHEPDR